MKTNVRRSLLQTCLLAAALLALPAAVQAQFPYSTNNDTITITVYTGPGGAVSIPAAINGLPVTSIGDWAFHEQHSLTSITIPGSVTSIGDVAFYDCTSLTNVTIGNGVTTIGRAAFSDCTNLTSVTIPNSATSIGGDAFFGCTSLTAITVDAKNLVYSSVNGVLYDKNQITLIQCPWGKTGTYTIPNTVTSIGDFAFPNCTSLASVTIPDSVTNIGNGAFQYCTNLTSITIPNSVTSIGGSAFQYCTSLTSITIPNSVISIWNEAFADCISLTNVTIGNGVTTIWVEAFADCTSLTAITVDAQNLVYSSVNGVLFDKNQTILIEYPPEGKGGDYSIPNSVTSIGYMAFESCTRLASITIPNSVTNIGDFAFPNCTSLASVTIPDSVTTIGSEAFYGCAGLTSVTISGRVTSIEEETFFGCSGLTSITIPDSVTNIGGGAFWYCSSLSNVTIPRSVASIEEVAFAFCTNLTSVTIPGSVTSIGGGAFANCSGLTSAYFMGDAPSFSWSFYYGRVFERDNDATVYYLPGASGWDSWDSSIAGAPAVLWNPQIQTSDANFGLHGNQFGFNITGTAGIPVLIEASANLASPVWFPQQTLTLTNGLVHFSEPVQTNSPSRFYRLRQQ